MNLEIRILGTMEVLVEGHKVSFGDRKQRLATALMAERGGRLERESFIRSLWPESDPVKAQGLLDGCISGIRNSLRETAPEAAGLVRTHHGVGYELTADPARVDYHRFTRSRIRSKSATSPSERLDLTRRALAEWGSRRLSLPGPIPFGGDVPESMRGIADRMRREYREVLFLHLRARLVCEPPQLLAPELDQLACDEFGVVEHRDQCEELTRLRMEAHYRSGDTAAADAAFGELASALARKRNSASRQTLELRRKIMNNEIPLRLVTDSPAAGTTGPEGDTAAGRSNGNPLPVTGKEDGPSEDAAASAAKEPGGSVFGHTIVTGTQARVFHLAPHANYHEGGEKL
ncbi:hypothetical protein Sme01_46040 [Sphaerisporangium melleum]|uniref:OmpR/PhoB-type domain-containing protein n=2 Tax=Sphaerisporangium melleum TaxID=321316 RepID=A0A917R0G0_9ACTN|nr:hypothetical protein GCM10007964_23040 [Sphaerisporangium melleum]GII72128.1 hypothetical protein Sme01_46040 [Sphaerisporangium melleum]